ncbi:membrane protein [Desulfosarcina ovata subsp. sediminis]|uniref:Membrane protein n=1 Tax=Desulfosarcina ovata subsp. sediminis TaxID=885957 RepID=A0A5K7ZSI1_9BACT|nr:GlsB/YeaQ/YmgE family stress response membrane protein [Desulfosarcina ovata]BBO83162.1 membrane protein [Desulfosarcina ovata subsp. sediminis]
MEFFWMILIGLIAGSLARQFMTGKGFGVVGDIITGMVGALIGGLLFERTGLFTGSSLVGSLLVATCGAIIFLYGVRVVKKKE